MSTQELAAALLHELGVSITQGNVTLHFDQGRLASVKTEIYRRIESEKALTPR